MNPPSPRRGRTPSPSRHIAALTIASPTTPDASHSLEQKHIKIPHLHSDVDAEDGHGGSDDQSAIPHKRVCTNADHADVALSRVVGGDTHVVAPGPVVKREPGAVGVPMELVLVKQEPVDDVDAAIRDVQQANGDAKVATSGVKDEPMDVKQEPPIEAVTGSGCEQNAAPLTRFVYRSVYATKPDWDRFVPVADGADFKRFGPHCTLRSSGTEASATIREQQDHLKHEYFHFTLSHKPRYAEAMEWRDLYALVIPDEELDEAKFTDSTAVNYSNTQKLLLGRLQVRILRHERVVIPNQLRKMAMAWFQHQFDTFGFDAKYPYKGWREHIARVEEHLQAAMDPVSMWKEGKSDEVCGQVIAAGLEANNRPASDFLG
ncbi:hypothetical protein BCR44DRAFT_25896 [Catenaria anguillulae PL171]|uniref:Uncharacterized protein n=1 Tax=Catenaria anguillulae PL171 TaxID=765915 RepID=A0A1Y2HVR8_9FUNG|nr:hypothetical protein BCR44DRAFT_25896 [Catenaria anguillulae PL171]